MEGLRIGFRRKLHVQSTYRVLSGYGTKRQGAVSELQDQAGCTSAFGVYLNNYSYVTYISHSHVANLYKRTELT